MKTCKVILSFGVVLFAAAAAFVAYDMANVRQDDVIDFPGGLQGYCVDEVWFHSQSNVTIITFKNGMLVDMKEVDMKEVKKP